MLRRAPTDGGGKRPESALLLLLLLPSLLWPEASRRQASLIEAPSRFNKESMTKEGASGEEEETEEDSGWGREREK